MAATVQVEKDDLLRAVRTAGEVLEGRSKRAHHGNIRLVSDGGGTLLVAGTAPAALVRVQLACSGQGQFDLHLGQKALFRLVRAFRDSTLKLDEHEGQLRLQSGKRKLLLEAAPGGEYDLAPEEIGGKIDWARLGGQEFGAALQLAASCAWPDRDRPVLHTVAIRPSSKKLEVVSSDSYRLLLLPLRAKVPMRSAVSPALLPLPAAKALAADLQRRKPEETLVQRWGEDEAQGVSVVYEDTSWNIALQSGSFPEWEELLPNAGHEISLRSRELREALSGIEAFGSTRKASRSSSLGALRLHLGQQIKVHYERPGTGTLEEELEESSWQGGGEMVFGANPDFLLDAIRIFSGQEILRAWAEKETKPLLFDDDDGRAYLLMPVRLTDIGE